jgi:hypothetical protein
MKWLNLSPLTQISAFAVFLLSTLASAFAIASPAQPMLIEVPIRHVIFPTTGYTDRDTIQAWIEGELPDPCYELGETTFSRDGAGNLLIHPHAWRHESEACDTGDMLEEGSYSIEISLGQLKAGDYNVEFTPEDGVLDYRKLHVAAAAQVSGQPELRAARVTALEMRNLFLEGQKVQATVQGQLSSACARITETPPIERHGDTIVVKIVETSVCSPRSEATSVPGTPFQKTIDLGVLSPGEYLLQARGQLGQSNQPIERVFRVVPTHLTSTEKAALRNVRLR